MIRGMYSAASALTAASLNHEVIADNIANATTPGYRRQGLVFETIQEAADQDSSRSGSRGLKASGSYTNFETGPIQYTGNPLDLSLSGKAFFTLDGPNGPLYTRNGTFERNARGQLQTHSGMTVRGGGGPVTIPPTATKITVTADGAVLADNVEVGRLQLTEFADQSALQRAGTTLFSGTGGRQATAGNFRVEQGYREGSNVQIVQEMVNMMIGMRHYEAAQRAMTAMGDAISQQTRNQSA